MQKFKKADIKKRLEKEIQFSVIDWDLCAKCSLYLGDKEKVKDYYKLAIQKNEITIQKLNEQGNMQYLAKRKLDTANYYRILNNNSEMGKILKEIEPIFRSLWSGYIKENPQNNPDFYFEWSTIHFHLGNYNDAYEIGKLCYKDHMPISPRDFAKGMLHGDNTIIEEGIAALVEFIKKDRWKPYSATLSVIDPWEWYEIGRQLLGLPSVLDMFKEDPNEQ